LFTELSDVAPQRRHGPRVAGSDRVIGFAGRIASDAAGLAGTAVCVLTMVFSARDRLVLSGMFVSLEGP